MKKYEEVPDLRSEQQKVMQEKHAQMNTPDSVIWDIVHEAGDFVVIDKNRIIAGETNEVYAIQTESGPELIVRISHEAKNRFKKEAWALRQCKEQGLPVPEVLLVKTIGEGVDIRHICVETKLPGIDLNKVQEGVSPQDEVIIPDLLRKLGVVLAKVHQVPTIGFGILDANGHGLYSSIDKFMSEDRYIRDEIIFEFLKDRPNDIEIVKKAQDIIQEESLKYASSPSCLVHNDLAPGHVLIDNNEISGVIDFESACGGDPFLEFALWEFKHGRKYPLNFILEGYATVNPDILKGDFQRKLNFWKIYRTLTSMRYCIKNGKNIAANRALLSIAETINFYDY